MSEEKHAENGTFGALHCAIFRTPSLRKSLGIHRFSGSRKGRTTGILHAMFIGACGPPEKLSLTLVPYSNALRMIVNLAYCVTRGPQHIATLIEVSLGFLPSSACEAL